jgi:hypothetical protein
MEFLVHTGYARRLTRYIDISPVFENLLGAKNSEVADPVDFQKIQWNSLKFGRIKFNVWKEQ